MSSRLMNLGKITARDLCVRQSGLYFHRRRFPCTIGRAGLTDDKREGDMATPRGVHLITNIHYRADRIARPCVFAEAIMPHHGWSDGCEDPFYNQMISRPHAYSHERLWRADSLYDLVITTDWNWPDAKKGKGSAIFFHQWRRPGAPTAGCVAVSRRDLRWIASRLTLGARLIVF